MATAHKLNRNYIGIEIGDQMTDLVVRRMNMVVNGENGGISTEVNWQGGGEFALYNYDKNKVEERKIEVKNGFHRQSVEYLQLDLFDLFDLYGQAPLVENVVVRDDTKIEYSKKGIIRQLTFDPTKNLLICYGQENEDKNDLRLFFEIERVGQLFDDYKKVKLEISRTFTDTTIDAILNT